MNINEDLANYASNLDVVLDHIEKEMASLEQQEDSKKKEKKVAKLKDAATEIAEMKKRLGDFVSYQSLNSNIEKLEDFTLTDDKIHDIYKDIVADFQNIDSIIKTNLGLSEEEAYDTDITINKLLGEKRRLEKNLKDLKDDELESTKERIEEIENKIESLDQYSDFCDKNRELVSKLKDFKSATSEEKEALYNEICELNETEFNKQLDAIREDMEKFESYENKYGKTKTESLIVVKDNWFKKNWKKLTAVVAAVGTVSIIGAVIAKSVNNENKDFNNDPTYSSDNTDPTGNDNTDSTTNENNDPTEVTDRSDILNDIEEITNPVILALIEKGYNEYSAKLMFENFNDETLKSLLTYFRPEVEKYASCKDFDINNLDAYEYAINKYDIPSEKAIDYVNRSCKILATGFYNEATVDNVCDVVKAIDDKTLFFGENATLAQSFNTAFNDIANNYLFGETTPEDIAKMDALHYFAKDDSEMDDFLTRYADIIKKILNEPNKNEHKTELFNFLNIFAHRNGINNNEEVLTSDKEFNEDADLDDYYNWFMAYNSFIAPLYPLAYPTEIELPPTTPIIPEGASEEMIEEAWKDLDAEWKRVEEENNQLDSKMRALEELQVYMITVLNGPEYNNFCEVNEGLIR